MAESRPSVGELGGRLREAYEGLRAALGGMEPAAADSGGWGELQVLGHVAFWDRYQTERLRRALAGESTPSELDEQADATVENDARASMEGRSREELLAESEAARAGLLELVASLSEEQLGARYKEGEWPLSLVQLIHQVGVWHVRAHTASRPGGEAYSGNPRELDGDWFPR